MGKKQKYYVVWDGHHPGVYKTWEECKLQTKNYPQAKYKSFPNQATAEEAFNMGFYEFQKLNKLHKLKSKLPQEVERNSICVDAASSGNPGKMEYRGVDTQTQKQLFHKGPFDQATNNIGEFLALVHGLAFLHQQKSSRAIYSDSRIAIGWVKKKHCKTKLKKTARNAEVFELIKRAEDWLKTHQYSTKILKWETKIWGEIPADFGRK
ncbi:ribonuclease H1 domain-containing protein [Mesohalobacter halotolerans]|jgi:ribonuclease HI|uniref:Ribonuclease H n=1 Tax=Mesohalobacter halotolerans TaxID=1883405 RepID=A0A4U5TU98_9FLAO|nr:ribonuclease H family protein [Mesohalobacter halotolerans]MBS3738587.1 ribonuclease H family protein [Psychroflexus sp.]NBC57729.1 ribonuclease H [Bacteroidota bacterium]TKS57074.1 ribonuclease H [Mesohalobacter halotolerans]